MRKAMLLLAVFGLMGTLWAADPSLGTWKLNLAKSKIPASDLAKPQGIHNRDESSGRQHV